MHQDIDSDEIDGKVELVINQLNKLAKVHNNFSKIYFK